MLFRKRKCSEEYSIERLKRELETADTVLIGAGAGAFHLLPDLFIPASVFIRISAILKRNTVFTICIPAAFIPIPA